MLKKHRILFLIICLSLQVLFVQWLGSKPEWVEQQYSRGYYRHLSDFLRLVFGNTDLPLGQFVFYLLIGFIGYWLLKICRRLWMKELSIKQFALALIRGVLVFFCWFYFLFTLMWGLNYHRVPIQQHVQINDRPFTIIELQKMCLKLIALTNQSRAELTSDTTQAVSLPFNKKQLLTEAIKGYNQAGKLNSIFKYSEPAVKGVLVPELMSVFGIGGIYFPFTGEANVNMDPPDFLLPEIICHEMAHQIGFASEDEANYVAYLVCRLHPEPSFQYSGNLTALKYAMNRLSTEDSLTFNKLKIQISPGVIHDLKKNRAYWESFENPIEVIGEYIHDLFLKANDQKEGIQSYSQVVELLMGEYRKNGLNIKPKNQKKSYQHQNK